MVADPATQIYDQLVLRLRRPVRRRIIVVKICPSYGKIALRDDYATLEEFVAAERQTAQLIAAMQKAARSGSPKETS